MEYFLNQANLHCYHYRSCPKALVWLLEQSANMGLFMKWNYLMIKMPFQTSAHQHWQLYISCIIFCIIFCHNAMAWNYRHCCPYPLFLSTLSSSSLSGKPSLTSDHSFCVIVDLFMSFIPVHLEPKWGRLSICYLPSQKVLQTDSMYGKYYISFTHMFHFFFAPSPPLL